MGELRQIQHARIRVVLDSRRLGFLLHQAKNKQPSGTPKCAIKASIRAMTYLRTLTLSFPGGQTNAYRINETQVEFQRGDGTWRVLSAEDVELHFALHTEVSKWLLKYKTERIRKDRA